MKSVSVGEAKKLARQSLAFALLLKDEEIEEVVVTFMEVLHQRKKYRGG